MGFHIVEWCALVDSNHRPPPCEGGALPLSQARVVGATFEAANRHDECRGSSVNRFLSIRDWRSPCLARRNVGRHRQKHRAPSGAGKKPYAENFRDVAHVAHHRRTDKVTNVGHRVHEGDAAVCDGGE